ncbi:hypothetical protein E4U23_006736 [Claviceps purpurea]|nr:hypothetical protein E4U23_006736 [Claviceps purpurea]
MERLCLVDGHGEAKAATPKGVFSSGKVMRGSTRNSESESPPSIRTWVTPVHKPLKSPADRGSVRSGQLELLEKYLLVCQAVHEQVEAVIHARRSGDIAVRLSEVQRDAVADRSSGVPGPQSAAGEGRPGKAFELTLLSRVETSR